MMNPAGSPDELVYALSVQPDSPNVNWMTNESGSPDSFQRKPQYNYLRDSAALWNKELDTRLNRIGIHALDDPCIPPTDEEVEQIFQQVKGEFGIKDMGEPYRFLRSAVIRNHVKRTITCRGYIRVTYSEVLSPTFY
ncbi:hypothetical protein N7491_002705 [Penicillium cf. griseofulvum]|uniref:Uncharacterized protein n=1 Tax=Penicillium cf. griseofulvum TaxID=2972120 RepID=A0A9W9MSI0_9EURO|nr:hypothetical protein N7472_003128 [Penicillium cf. griseofulvum]KAJ5440299.1 hypothetical protein N7491_002705 [Penicillium cf. griseofulvum]KAJ5448347.1 hypothetical protein N7445_003168 [Penicillium cf. griseofulvum]